MTQEPIAVDDVLALVRKEMDAIDDVRLFYELRKRHIRYINVSQSFSIVKAIVALTKLGLPINTHIIKTILKLYYFPHNALHCLGDKHLLVLKRVSGRRYKWLPSKLLKEIIESVEAKKP